MQLINDWRGTLLHAHSVKLMIAATVFSIAEATLPIINMMVAIPPYLFLSLTILCTAVAVPARLIAQRKVSDGAP